MATSENTMIPHPKMPHVHWCLVQLRFRNLHFHDTFELCCVLDGTAELLYGDQSIVIRKGDFMLLNANEPHEVTSTTSSTLLLCTQISNSFCHDYFPSVQQMVFHDVLITPYLSEETRGRLLQLILEGATAYWNTSDHYPFTCVSITALILQLLFRNIPHHKISTSEYESRRQTAEIMNQVKNYVQENFAEDTLLQKLANHVGFTSTYMSHYFKKNFHVTFQQYLMRLRLEKAVQMLVTTKMPILDICTHCGFSDYRQLNKYCRNEFGLSARDCRGQSFANSKSYRSFTPTDPMTDQYLFTDQECLEYFSQHNIFDIYLTNESGIL